MVKFLNEYPFLQMPSGEESIRGLSITYTAVTRHHSGVYICDADNGFGDISSATLKLDVQRKFIKLNVIIHHEPF